MCFVFLFRRSIPNIHCVHSSNESAFPISYISSHQDLSHSLLRVAPKSYECRIAVLGFSVVLVGIERPLLADPR